MLSRLISRSTRRLVVGWVLRLALSCHVHPMNDKNEATWSWLC